MSPPAWPVKAARPSRTWCSGSDAASGRYYVCPICFDARKLDKGDLVPDAELAGTVPLWEWIGEDGATTFSY